MSVAAGDSGPPGRSLQPLDVEEVRRRHGQEVLFRLRLGVDAARDDAAACPVPLPPWNGSNQQAQLLRLLNDGQPYAAGLILGAWQLRQQRCGGGGAALGGEAGVPAR